ncbi:AbrB/MazE/SpoVT family DNA-binding domain-containing protein [Methanobrevibacter filiformis]|uniref:SpoVT-AbrB domain-containing protein n=1 Tax=Methanobrevibacter filiformis TaxID=55758 RepID=A0A166CW39_9EURY|nr:hypothetical protein [Methanobrevibacter filiformis]KZX17207.1 hypothetical protein MBFIL_02770 [Methanobrevibacter filiformis]
MTETSKLYKGFQTTIPKNIRNKINLDLEHVLDWDVLENGEIRVTPRKSTDFMSMCGMFKSKGPADAVKSVRKMREGREDY